MARYQFIIAYDGTHFEGFQRQEKARTVQGEVEKALHKLNWDGKAILAAGRTDTGTHADGQVIAFDLDWAHSPLELSRAVNANLPADIVVKQASTVRSDFHPRFDAVARCYCYRLFHAFERDPLRERYAWRVQSEVDVDLLNEAAQVLIGTHDFSSFGAPTRPGGSTIREVCQADWEAQREFLQFEIRANAFLYHMVRRLVYLQVLVGQNRFSLDEFRRGVLETKNQPPGLAPAHGLVLSEVFYPPTGMLDFDQPEIRSG
jgi:tRNA pseudouridine38-40 synthase